MKAFIVALIALFGLTACVEQQPDAAYWGKLAKEVGKANR